MKQGMTLTELAQELERQQEKKRDYVAESKALSVVVHEPKDAKKDIRLEVDGVGRFEIGDHARNQLASKLAIPLAYFKRLEADHPDLLATNVNTLFAREPQRSMVRTLDGKVRGILSDRYRALDYYDLGKAVIPVLIESGAKVESCDITETKMYIKALLPWLDRELPVPEGLKMGVGHNFFLRRVIGSITIGDSEVGNGSVSISPGIFEKQCTNLATFRDEGFSKMHVGKKAAGDDAVTKYLSDETRRLDDAAVWARVRDVTKATMDGRVIDEIVKRLQAAREDAITGNPAKVVEVFAKTRLNEDEKGGLLKYLTNSGEMTRYGLQWAVTRLSQDVESYDRASELERMGGEVIELAQGEWEVLAKAA